METIRSLFDKFNRPIFLRIESQFGNLAVEDEINSEMSNGEIYRRVTSGKGKGKPHNLKHYPKDEGKKKFS
jgi:hypothetical protein